MAEFPKLTKAQQEAWARILEWYAQEDRDDDFSGYDVRVHSNTLEAMKNKGVLSSVWSGFVSPMPRYTIHPDYLPAAEPATDARPNTDEARLIDSITEARIERQRLENENASLTSQLEALRVYVKELEAENAKLRAAVTNVYNIAADDLVDWLTVTMDYVPDDKIAMKSVYERVYEFIPDES